MKNIIFAALLALITLTACDDGQIEEQRTVFTTGHIVKLTGQLQGLQNWSERYNVALAGFDEKGEYAIIAKTVQADNQVNVNVTLSDLGDNVKTIRLCVLDRLRRHVMSFRQIDIPDTRDTIRMELGTVNVGMLEAIQLSYFNTTCANCHGASNRTAARLNLTAGHSYAAMVGQPSTKVPGMNIVEPGDAEHSLLHQVLRQEKVEGISMIHHDLVSEQNEQYILPLIDSWINNGAKEN